MNITFFFTIACPVSMRLESRFQTHLFYTGSSSRDLRSFPETIRCSRPVREHFRHCTGISGTRKTRFYRKNGRRGSISKFSRKWSINHGIAYVHVSVLSERWLSYPGSISLTFYDRSYPVTSLSFILHLLSAISSLKPFPFPLWRWFSQLQILANLKWIIYNIY